MSLIEKENRNQISKPPEESINVWRLDDIEGIELRSGSAVKAPYPKHWHEEYQFCFIQEGGGELIYRGKYHNTPKISLFVVHPGEVHANRSATGCSFRSVYVHPKVIENTLADSADKKRTLPFFPDPMVFDKEIIADYLKFHLALENSETTLESETVLLEMLTKLINRYAQEKTDSETFGNEHRAVKKIRDYIIDHFDQKISLQKLSKLVNLSQFHLNRVFSREVGMPPHAFQNQVRITRAKQLIKNGVPLSEVAVETGFADQSHFHRHFKKLMLITPGEY
jgi:AraC-like DNA-binding protein